MTALSMELSRDKFEIVGDYVMGRMLGSTQAHEQMDASTQARYARGEIDAEDYDLKRRALGGTT